MPSGAAEIKAAVLKLAGAPNLADKSWVTAQYDKYVQGNTIQAQPDDSVPDAANWCDGKIYRKTG